MATTRDGKKLEIDEEPRTVSQEADQINPSGVSELNIHQDGNSAGISELEEMMNRRTFTWSETQQLIALLHSRTIQEPPSDNFLAPIKSSRVVEEEVASPVELATCLSKMSMASPQHPTTMENLPDELLLNIFTHLLAKQVSQMRSVSKSWNALLSQSSFIKSHLHRSIQNNEQFLLVFHGEEKSKQFTTHSCRSPHLELPNFIKLPANPRPLDANGISVIGAINGLICSSYSDSVIHIWNPSLSVVLTLPPYSMPPSDDYEWIAVFFRFGFDPRTDDYKVVKLTAFADLSLDVVRWWMDVEIYSMRKGSWKLITERPPSHITWIHEGQVVCVDGHEGRLHWLCCTNEELHSTTIVAFDLGSETFREIPLPHSLAMYKYDRSKSLGVLDGKLCLMAWGENDACEVWVMGKYGMAESWVKRHVFSQFTSGSFPIGFTLHNEFLIDEHFCHLVLYDPVTGQSQIFQDHSSYPAEYDVDKIVEYVDSLVWVAPAKHETVDIGASQN